MLTIIFSTFDIARLQVIMIFESRVNENKKIRDQFLAQKKKKIYKHQIKITLFFSIILCLFINIFTQIKLLFILITIVNKKRYVL